MVMLNNQRVIRCNNHPNRGVLMLTCTMATCDSPSDGRDPWPTNISRSRSSGPGHAIATDAAVLDHYRQWLQMPFRAAKQPQKVGQLAVPQQGIKVKPGDHHHKTKMVTQKNRVDCHHSTRISHISIVWVLLYWLVVLLHLKHLWVDGDHHSI